MAGTTTQRRTTSILGDTNHSTTHNHNLLVDDVEILRAAGAGAVLTGSSTYDPPSLATGVGATTTIAVASAAMGDFVQASFSNDLQGIQLTGYVSAAGTVSCRFFNATAGTLDLASGTLRVRVVQQAAAVAVPAATLTAARVGDASGTVL